MTLPPPLLRQLGNYAVASWSSECLLRDWRELHRLGYTPASLGKIFATMFRKDEERDTLKDYGPAHPEAPGDRGRR